MKKIVKVLFAFLLSALFAVVGGVTVSAIVGVSPYIPMATFFALSLIPVPNGVFAVSLFTAPGGIGTAFKWTGLFLPQHLMFDNTNEILDLKIETAEDGVLHDLDSDAIKAISNLFMIGQEPNSAYLRICDGKMQGKNVIISGHTSKAGEVEFFATSTLVGGRLYRTKNLNIAEKNPTTVEKFTAIFIPDMAAGDRADIVYSNGLTESLEMYELKVLSGLAGNKTGIMINNNAGKISKVTIQCAAKTAAYVLNIG